MSCTTAPRSCFANLGTSHLRAEARRSARGLASPRSMHTRFFHSRATSTASITSTSVCARAFRSRPGTHCCITRALRARPNQTLCVLSAGAQSGARCLRPPPVSAAHLPADVPRARCAQIMSCSLFGKLCSTSRNRWRRVRWNVHTGTRMDERRRQRRPPGHEGACAGPRRVEHRLSAAR